MKIQVFHIFTGALFAGVTLLSTAHEAEARPGMRAQTGQCMIHREYKNDKRVMQYFSQDVIEDQDAGLTKKSCERACKKRGLELPEEHVRHLRDATNVFFACQYNTMKKEESQYGPVFNSNIPLANLKVAKKEDKKTGSGRLPSPRYTPRRNTVENIVEETAPPPAPPMAPQPPNYDGGVATEGKVPNRYDPIPQQVIPNKDPNTSRDIEDYQRQRRPIRRPRVY